MIVYIDGINDDRRREGEEDDDTLWRSSRLNSPREWCKQTKEA
jgi:hypothetical protein